MYDGSKFNKFTKRTNSETDFSLNLTIFTFMDMVDFVFNFQDTTLSSKTLSSKALSSKEHLSNGTLVERNIRLT